MKSFISLLAILLASISTLSAQPEIPAIDYVVVDSEPFASDPDVIFYDDFEITQDLSVNYHDVGRTGFGVSDEEAFGGSGYAIRQFYAAGQVNGGWAWHLFGDNPSLPGADKPSYNEVYVRWYHKFPDGFQGFPPKMARLGSFALSNWTLAFMVHYWIAGSLSNVVADVAVNIPVGGNAPGESGYNNFDHWLPVARTSFSFGQNTGRWICHEMRVKVNDPGESNASYEYWADGKSIVRKSGRSLRENWSATSINAMQWDTYWNSGSPAAQARYYDNLVISSKPIGPVMVSLTPTLAKTPYAGAGTQGSWQAQIATDSGGNDVVWDSGERATTELKMVVDDSAGVFAGSLEGRSSLGSGSIYFAKTRQQQSGGDWSEWSTWHSPFQTPPNTPVAIVARYPGHSSIVLDPGATVTFRVTAEDAEGDSLAYGWKIDGESVDASADSLLYTATDALEQTVTVTVDDGENALSKTWQVSHNLIGDLDGDNAVDFTDFLLFVQSFNTSDPAADFDASGRVDFQDFLTFVTNFGRRRL